MPASKKGIHGSVHHFAFPNNKGALMQWLKRWIGQAPAAGSRPRAHFLHIGKTGGTAVKHVLKEHPAVQEGHFVLHGHKTTMADIPAGEKVCFFLRDPVSRFVSAFYSRQRKGQPRYNSDWNPIEKEVFEAFPTADRLAVSLGGGAES